MYIILATRFYKSKYLMMVV